MIAACVVLSLDGFVYAFPFVIVAMLLRMLTQPVRLRGFSSYDPFILLFLLWGMFVSAPREHWTDMTILISRIVTLLLMLAAAGWCLFRDWHRFRISDETTHGSS